MLKKPTLCSFEDRPLRLWSGAVGDCRGGIGVARGGGEDEGDEPMRLRYLRWMKT